MPTPYDNRVALWFWKGDSVPETSIDQLAQTIKRWAPAVSAVIVKTSDGSNWQGSHDRSRAIAIDGISNVDQWIQTLTRYGLDFHAWAVPKGVDIAHESEKIIQVCQRPGIKSLILDVEPYNGFYTGGKQSIRPLMTAIRAALPATFHIGLSMDPRPQQYAAIYPEEWLPFVQSVHPQVYWASFQQTPEEALDAAFATWTPFGRPIFPVLQGNADLGTMQRARSAAISKYHVTGLSWWRLGAISATQWPAINVNVDGTTPAPPSIEPQGGRFGSDIIVKPDDAGYHEGAYDDKPPSSLLKPFTDKQNWPTKFKPTTNLASAIWARWDPQLTVSGWYELSAYVPSQHATTANARYKIHNVLHRTGESEVALAQSLYFDQWVSLGVYQFDANDPTAGVVFLNDLTGEAGKEIVFGALRWRQITGQQINTPYVSDGFDAPIGTVEDRLSSAMWPGKWIDATGYAVRYRTGTPQEAYHTGADLNLNAPYFDADAHTPVCAAASGVITYVGKITGWGRIIVIRHDPLVGSGHVVYARYAHIEAPSVELGQRVARGEEIAKVGNADGAFPYHLHFDISPTTILDTQPGHWPGLDLNNLLTNYVDPRLFVAQHRPQS